MADVGRHAPTQVLATLFAAPVVPVHAEVDGARLAKLFPAGSVGPAHLAHLRGPDRTTRFMPTGGLAARCATALDAVRAARPADVAAP